MIDAIKLFHRDRRTVMERVFLLYASDNRAARSNSNGSGSGAVVVAELSSERGGEYAAGAVYSAVH